MGAIETTNPLKGVLPKDYNRPALDKVIAGRVRRCEETYEIGKAGLFDLLMGSAKRRPSCRYPSTGVATRQRQLV
jgi:hypothetical protein